jgi:hypothetical protein
MSDGLGSAAMEVAVADLERALCRDRSHALLVATGPESHQARVLRALAGRLAGCLDVVLLTDPGIGEAEICAQILISLGQEPAVGAELQLAGLVKQLASRESALVLLISDANCMPAATLRCLGRLASDLRPGLRLGLVVAIEDCAEADPVAAVVAVLGVGVEKVVLDEANTNAATSVFAYPPRVVVPASADPGAAPLPGPRAEASGLAPTLRTGFRLGLWPRRASAILGILIALFGVYELAVPAASQEVAFELESEPVEEAGPIGFTQPAVPQLEVQHPVAVSVVQEEPSQPEQVSRRAFASAARAVAVSLNSRPWARIELDGRDIGMTPLGDVPMSPGPHRFRAHLADGRVVERVVLVDAYRNHIGFP